MDTSTFQDLDTQTLKFIHDINVSQRQILETAIGASRKCIAERQAGIVELQTQLNQLVDEGMAVTIHLNDRGML
jgi:hypothetical protein